MEEKNSIELEERNVVSRRRSQTVFSATKFFHQPPPQNIKVVRIDRKSGFISDLKQWFDDGLFKPVASHAGRKRYKLIHPRSQLIIIWSMLQALILLLIAVSIPLRLAFDPTDSCSVSLGWAFLDLIVDSFFLLDVVLQFFSCRRIDQVLVDDRKTVMRDYLIKEFWIDIVKCFPISYVQVPLWATGQCEDNLAILQMMKILRTLRILRLARLANLLRLKGAVSFSHRLITNPNGVRLLKLCGLMVFSLHCAACAWWYVKRQTPDLLDFEESQKVQNSDPSRYLISLYFAVSTMTTTGYGDVRGTNDNERVVALFIMAVGGMLFATIISQFSTLSMSLGASDSAAEARKTEAIKYLDARKVPRHLQQRVNEFYDHFNTHASLLPKHEILDDLPNSLKHELLLTMATETLTKVHIFRESEAEFLLAIYSRLVPMRAAPGEVLTTEGAIGTEMYFIMSGTILVMVENGTKVVGELSDGDVFGEMAVLTGGRRNASCITKDFCELYVLEKASLDEVLVEFPGFKEQLRIRAVQMNKIRNKISSTLRFVAKLPTAKPPPNQNKVVPILEDDSISQSNSFARKTKSFGKENGEISSAGIPGLLPPDAPPLDDNNSEKTSFRRSISEPNIPSDEAIGKSNVVQKGNKIAPLPVIWSNPQSPDTSNKSPLPGIAADHRDVANTATVTTTTNGNNKVTIEVGEDIHPVKLAEDIAAAFGRTERSPSFTSETPLRQLNTDLFSSMPSVAVPSNDLQYAQQQEISKIIRNKVHNANVALQVLVSNKNLQRVLTASKIMSRCGEEACDTLSSTITVLRQCLTDIEYLSQASSDEHQQGKDE